jgi:hypothetical protein
VPAEDRHASDAIAEAATSPAGGADQPKHAAAPARPWPFVKQPTVRTDRSLALNPSAMRPWTLRHDGPQRSKMTHDGTEKTARQPRESAASGPFSLVVAGVGFEPT